MPHSRGSELLPHGAALIAAHLEKHGVPENGDDGRDWACAGGRAALGIWREQSLRISRSSKHKVTTERLQASGLGLCHQHTHPQKGGKSLAVVSNGKVVWLGPEDFHDVFIEFCLLDLEGENS